MIKNIVLICCMLFLLAGCSNQKKEEENENTENSTNEVNMSQTATQTNITENVVLPQTPTAEEAPKETPKEEKEQPEAVKQPEEELASFSTKIYTKDSERQNNVGITCSKLNGTTVKAGSTFSFTKTIGPATSSKGYQEADIFDSNGNKKKGLGGGNCQVSTTLYNAVLKVSSLSVTERHEHSRDVPYIPDGKDAAVAYGSVDLKFKNTNSYDIKIYAQATKNNVTIRLVKI